MNLGRPPEIVRIGRPVAIVKLGRPVGMIKLGRPNNPMRLTLQQDGVVQLSSSDRAVQRVVTTGGAAAGPWRRW